MYSFKKRRAKRKKCHNQKSIKDTSTLITNIENIGTSANLRMQKNSKIERGEEYMKSKNFLAFKKSA